MTSETLFLKTTSSAPKPINNVASGAGNLNVSNLTENSTAVLTSAEANTLVSGGVSAAIAEAAASYIASEDFSNVFNSSTVIGADGTYQGIASSRAEIVATYAVKPGDTLGFNFQADLALQATEIEKPSQYYSLAEQKTSFLLIDLDPPQSRVRQWSESKIIGHFGIGGMLESAQKSLKETYSKSRNVTVSSDQKAVDVDGNNHQDFLRRQVEGQFLETFSDHSRIALVKITSNFVKLEGDELIGGLGQSVTYGTIKNDYLYASRRGGKVYASLGNDTLKGSSRGDILEGGRGNDKLYGHWGNDKLNGGSGQDILKGGSGDDLLVGGTGHDQLYGSYGSDTLVGVDFRSNSAGANEIDRLNGGGYPTRGIYENFVLGDHKQAYYRSAGNQDYALIDDFAKGLDKIWLHGKPSDYSVTYESSLNYRRGRKPSDGLGFGSRIYRNTDGVKELIGVAQDVNLSGHLKSSYVFKYNQTISA